MDQPPLERLERVGRRIASKGGDFFSGRSGSEQKPSHPLQHSSPLLGRSRQGQGAAQPFGNPLGPPARDAIHRLVLRVIVDADRTGERQFVARPVLMKPSG